MNANAAPVPFLRLSLVIQGLREALGGWQVKGVLGAVLALLLHRRLGVICGQMERLAVRFRAGRLWRVTRAPRTRVPAGEAARRRGKRDWPGDFAWLVRVGSYQAAGFGSQLRAVLAEPEMVALLEAAPQARRVLRPLCRMLGVEASVLRPGVAASRPAVVREKTAVKRVRKARAKVDWGRIPLPRGVLAAARRQGFGKRPTD